MYRCGLFSMKDDQTIVKMFTRFTNITNRPQALIHEIKEHDEVLEVPFQEITSQSHDNPRGKRPHQIPMRS